MFAHPSVITFRDYTRGHRRVLMVVTNVRHALQVKKIHAVAASLPGSAARSRKAASRKQEPPGPASPEGSTDPRQVMADGMAAGAKCYRGR